jgi:hypothetical protein
MAPVITIVRVMPKPEAAQQNSLAVSTFALLHWKSAVT